MRDVRIPMRDSVTLSADVYLPSKEKGDLFESFFFFFCKDFVPL
jgi:hypothetical protein